MVSNRCIVYTRTGYFEVTQHIAMKLGWGPPFKKDGEDVVPFRS